MQNEESSSAGETERVHSPEEIAQQVGGMSVKSLCDLIRTQRLETTTLGYGKPSPRGGPRRRIWGMTDAQLEELLARRRSRAKGVPMIDDHIAG